MKEIINNLDWTSIFEGLIAAIVLAIGTYLIPWLKSEKESRKAEKLSFWIKETVKAAEQIFGGERGEEKLSYVRHRLLELGLWEDTDVHRALVEASVYELDNLNTTNFDKLEVADV